MSTPSVNYKCGLCGESMEGSPFLYHEKCLGPQLPTVKESSESLTHQELRAKIEELEAAMKAMPEHQIEIEPKHFFAHGLYAREIFIPKGTTLTGKIHLYSHINVISKGDISVMTDNGIERIKAPCTIISKPGTKRAGYAHEDTIWTTFHATSETDPVKVEKALVVDSYVALEESQKKLLEEK